MLQVLAWSWYGNSRNVGSEAVLLDFAVGGGAVDYQRGIFWWIFSAAVVSKAGNEYVGGREGVGFAGECDRGDGGVCCKGFDFVWGYSGRLYPWSGCCVDVRDCVCGDALFDRTWVGWGCDVGQVGGEWVDAVDVVVVGAWDFDACVRPVSGGASGAAGIECVLAMDDLAGCGLVT